MFRLEFFFHTLRADDRIMRIIWSIALILMLTNAENQAGNFLNFL